jgi:hypothetical protein
VTLDEVVDNLVAIRHDEQQLRARLRMILYPLAHMAVQHTVITNQNTTAEPSTN